MGFNIAEAVNFALEDWLAIGCNTGVCRCMPDSVNIDFQRFFFNLGRDLTKYLRLKRGSKSKALAVSPSSKIVSSKVQALKKRIW